MSDKPAEGADVSAGASAGVSAGAGASADASADAGEASHASESGHGRDDRLIPPELLARRKFLARVSLGLGAAGGVALTVPLAGFVVAPLGRRIPLLYRSVGKVSDFKIGETVKVTFVDPSPLPWAGVTANTGAWLRRIDQNKFRAFAINCAHLGCPVRWLPDAHLFMCPCHGGVYYEDGSVAAGPPPHPLSQYIVRVDGDDVQIRAEPIPME